MPRYSVEQVKSAAAGQWVAILSEVAGIPSELLDGKERPCPKCGGDTRFRLMDGSVGAVRCSHCFATKCGDGLSAIQWAKGIAFPQAIEEVGRFLNLPEMANGHAAPPIDERIQFITGRLESAWLQIHARRWCESKPGTNIGHALSAGMKTGSWGGFAVVAFPGFDPRDYSKPAAWLMYRTDGHDFPPVGHYRERKTHLVGGSKDSLIIIGTPDDLKSASVIWKCEGTTDAIALAGHLPPGHVAITNACGCSSFPEHLAEAFAGKAVRVLHDADTPGQNGTARVVTASVKHAREARNIILPYMIEDTHGKDVRDWLNEGHGFDELEALAKTSPPQSDPRAQPIEFKGITCAELASGDYRVEFLIERTLVDRQPCIIAGGKKMLKTSILVDMGIALATGCKFLGRLEVKSTRRVALMSGESGMGTLQETAFRVAAAAGLHLAEIENLIWCDQLPRFLDPGHQIALRKFLADSGTEVVIIDPAYLCMSTDSREGSLFAMGEQLAGITNLCNDVGASLILAHHTVKNNRRENPFSPPELEDIAWAGFQEFARQWLLVGRRERFEPGTGAHRLWLNVGGSAGHSAMWALDVEEGEWNEHQARKWEVSLVKPDEAIKVSGDRKAKDKEERRAERMEEVKRRIVAKLCKYPSGETKSAIRELAHLDGKEVNAAFMELEKDGVIEHCEIVKPPRKNPQPAFRLISERDAGDAGVTGVEMPEFLRDVDGEMAE